MLIRLLYDKLLLDQVHGKAGAKFNLTLLFHSSIYRQTRRLPVKNAIGKNQDQKSEFDPEMPKTCQSSQISRKYRFWKSIEENDFTSHGRCYAMHFCAYGGR